MAKKSVKETKDDQIITLDGIDHKYSDLTDEGKIIVNQLNIIESEILKTKMLLDRHHAAKHSFIGQFQSIISSEDTQERH